jgi:MoaA/NifB/PqqE/SkfB family radical SAM enzyme
LAAADRDADTREPELTVCIDAVQCSSRCRHCEVTHGRSQRHLTLQEISRWRDRIHEMAAQAGTSVEVGLTNKEFLDHPRWREIHRELGGGRWGPYLATNGRRIAREPELIGELKEKGFQRVQLTLFGPEAATHDEFARRPGAFQDRMTAGRLAREAGLPVDWVYIAYSPLSALGAMSRIAHELFGPEANESVFLIKPQGQGLKMEHLRPSEAELQQAPEHLLSRFPRWFGAGCETEGDLVLALREGKRRIGCRETGGDPDRQLILYRNGDAYPVCHECEPAYLLGNLERDGLQPVLDALRGADPPRALALRRRGLQELAMRYGDGAGKRLHHGCSLCRTLVRRALAGEQWRGGAMTCRAPKHA